MALIPAFGSEPKADGDGVHFEMKAPSGNIIRCSIHPDIFKERLASDTDVNRLTFFEKYKNKFFEAAIEMHNRTPMSDDPVHIGFRDVHFRELPERDD
jgi:hypothetical protein